MSEDVSAAGFSPLPERRLKMSWAVGGSIALHVLLVAGIFALTMFEPAPIELPQKPVSARLVRLGTKKDPKLLPRKNVAPPPPPKTVEVPVPGTKPVELKAREPAKTAAPSSDAKPAASANRNRLFDAFAKTAARSSTTVEEPSGDPDGDPDGDSDTAEEGERYFGLILAKARRNYGITKTISPEELVRLKATVVLYINSLGELMRDPEIAVSSGNDRFDQDVLISLKQAAPFGPPPESLVKTLRTVGVAIEARP